MIRRMRVVQDSDDEFDEDIEGDAPSKPEDASAERLTNKSIRTGSTESLKRAIEEAHRVHLQSQPSQSELRSSSSLPEPPNKRRKTSASGIRGESQNSLSRRTKSPVTPDRQFKYLADNLSPDLVEDGRGIRAINFPDIAHRSDEKLDGAIRVSHSIRNPQAMNLEPSSTIPNATFTQQQIMEAIRNPMVDRDIEVETVRHVPKSSLPWSDWVNFSTDNSGEHAHSSGQQQSVSGIAPATELPPRPHEEPKPESDRRFQGPSHCLRDSTEDIQKNLNVSAVIGPPCDANSVVEIIPVPPSGSHRLAKEKIAGASHQRRRQASSPPSSEDDLVTIDLPKEQYKPRPSRSRSVQTSLDSSIDYSVRPEKVGKSSRRRKTTAATSSTDLSTRSEKIQLICDMGFTSSMAAGALENNHGDIQRSIDWLVTNRIGEDELGSHEIPKKRQGSRRKSSNKTMDFDTIEVRTPRKNEMQSLPLKSTPGIFELEIAGQGSKATSLADTETRNLAPSIASSTSPLKTPKVQVVIPRQSPRGDTALGLHSAHASEETEKHKSGLSDLPETEAQLGQEHGTPPQVAVKKRGRGRPRKEVNAKVSTEKTSEELEEKQQSEPHHQALQPVQPDSFTLDSLAETSGLPRHDTTEALEGIGEKAEAFASIPPKAAVASKAPQASEASAKPSKNDSTTKNKVPYRVGLSNRVRIAPLLRTLKK